MILFLAGMMIGAGVGVFAFALIKGADTHADEEHETYAPTARLNEEQTEREQLLKEQERQHENMMNYIGKEQKR